MQIDRPFRDVLNGEAGAAMMAVHLRENYIGVVCVCVFLEYVTVVFKM